MLKTIKEKLIEGWGFLRNNFITNFGLSIFIISSVLYTTTFFNIGFIYSYQLFLAGIFIGYLSILNLILISNKNYGVTKNIISINFIIFIIGICLQSLLTLMSFLDLQLVSNKIQTVIILVTICSGFITFLTKKNTTHSFSRKNFIIEIVILTIILIIAFVIRIHRIDEVSFWFDELLHISSLGIIPTYPLGDIYSRAIITNWFIFLSTNFFIVNEFFSRLPSVIISILSLFTSYLLAKKFLENKYALIFTLFLSINIIDIVFSQEARYFPYLSFLLITAQLIYLSRIKFKFLLFILIAILGINANFIFILSIIPIIILYLIEKNIFKKLPKLLILLGLSTFLFFIFYYIYDQGLFNKIGFNKEYLTFLSPWIIISFFALLSSLDKKNIVLFLPIGLTLTALIFIESNQVPAQRYIAHLNVPFLILLFVFLSKIEKMFSNKKLGKVFVGIILFFSLIINLKYLYDFQTVNFLKIKEEYTWTRPDYKSWSKFEMKPDRIIISNVPHISNFYVGNTDYFLGENTFEISKIDSSRELRSGVIVINKDELDFITKNKCAYIFADYRKEYMWSLETKQTININFEDTGAGGYRTFIYASKSCRLE